MGRQTLSIFAIVTLILFCIGVLFVGQEYSSGSKLVTVRIGGISDTPSEKNIQDMMKMVTGVEALILDKDAGLWAFRYDSSEINFKTIESQFSALGLTITPIIPTEKLGIIPQSSEKKLIRIRFSDSES